MSANIIPMPIIKMDEWPKHKHTKHFLTLKPKLQPKIDCDKIKWNIIFRTPDAGVSLKSLFSSRTRLNWVEKLFRFGI